MITIMDNNVAMIYWLVQLIGRREKVTLIAPSGWTTGPLAGICGNVQKYIMDCDDNNDNNINDNNKSRPAGMSVQKLQTNK